MIGFPLLLIPLTIANLVVFLMPGVPFSAPLIAPTLPSLRNLHLTLGDALLLLALALLLAEIIKAARPGRRVLMDHLLSLVSLGVALGELVMLPAFAHSAFLLLTAMIAVEFVAGIVLSLRRRVPLASPAEPAPTHDVPAPHTPAHIEPAPDLPGAPST